MPDGHPDPPLRPEVVQDILDGLPGGYSWVVPVRDAAGEVVDFETRAVSPGAVDVAGRRGERLVGVRVSEVYPGVKDGPIWAANLRVLADGQPREVGPYTHVEVDEGTPAESTYSVRIRRLGGGLLVGWEPQDDETRRGARVARSERLGNLGWAEWDLVSGEVVWSDGLYRIFERDPADGPLSNVDAAALVVPEDQPRRAENAATLAAGGVVEATYRLRIGDRVKHVRSVLEAVRDATGKPVRIYGVLQDVTAEEAARERLVQLQQIILPIPDGPVDLHGLRVAVRYLPAERASRVGGDWFQATETAGGGVLLAVGDVSGHGIQAATTMARLRYALAALAVTTTTDPATLLGHLNHLLCADSTVTDTATAVIGYYEPGARTLTWAQAGHPAPLRTRDGVTVLLPRPRGPLLGVLTDAEYGRARVAVEPGDLLLLYTDGLVENREQGVVDGLAPVVATLDRITGRGSTQPLVELIAQLRRANPDDDTCILAARPLDVPGRGELLRRDVALDGIVAVRHEVERRCAAAGLSGTGLYWFVVAVNEITTNAVRHGGGTGEVSLWRDGERLHCRVVDRGPGIPPERQAVDVRPPPDTVGGRGLWLARQGCTAMAIDSSPAGTRVTLTVSVVPPGQDQGIGQLS